MKQPWEWTEDELLELIKNGTKESVELDYKACDALAKTDGKKKEVSKDVSALANSAGGTLVYGIIEDKYVPVRLDVGYDPADISKEWLEQVIHSNIHRRLDGVRINQVDLAKTSPGRVAYVVFVPQSMRAPHQAADKRFYKRFNFESVPMEEYEIRDVARRFEAPDLGLELQLPGLSKVNLDFKGETAEVGISPYITNYSDTPAEFAVICVFVDTRLSLSEQLGELQAGGHEVVTAWMRTFLCQRLNMKWGRGKMPVFQGVRFGLLGHPLVIGVPAGPGEYLLASQIHSPRMRAKWEHHLLVSDGKAVHFIDLP